MKNYVDASVLIAVLAEEPAREPSANSEPLAHRATTYDIHADVGI